MQKIFDKILSELKPLATAIETILSGLNVPCVSTKITLFCSSVVAAITASVWQICVLPVPLAPKNSVTAFVSIPPKSKLSNDSEPVEIRSTFDPG
jgi:hypothetical protein